MDIKLLRQLLAYKHNMHDINDQTRHDSINTYYENNNYI